MFDPGTSALSHLGHILFSRSVSSLTKDVHAPLPIYGLAPTSMLRAGPRAGLRCTRVCCAHPPLGEPPQEINTHFCMINDLYLRYAREGDVLDSAFTRLRGRTPASRPTICVSHLFSSWGRRESKEHSERERDLCKARQYQAQASRFRQKRRNGRNYSWDASKKKF